MTAITADMDAAAARRRFALGRLAVYGALALFGVIYLTPALAVLLSAFRSSADIYAHGLLAWPRSFSLADWGHVWSSTCVSGTCQGIRPNFFNSLQLAIPATLVATALGAVNGYVLSKWRFPGANLVFGMMLLGVFMPAQITLLPWAWIMGRLGLANNINGLILIHIVQGISFTTLFCRNFYASIPDEIIKAARIDGAGFWRIFGRVVLPLSGPILAVTVIWQFTSIWNEYLFGMVFTAGSQQPITAALMSPGPGNSSVAVLIAAIPPLIVYLLGGQYFVRGLTQGALK